MELRKLLRSLCNQPQDQNRNRDFKGDVKDSDTQLGVIGFPSDDIITDQHHRADKDIERNALRMARLSLRPVRRKVRTGNTGGSRPRLISGSPEGLLGGAIEAAAEERSGRWCRFDPVEEEAPRHWEEAVARLCRVAAVPATQGWSVDPRRPSPGSAETGARYRSRRPR